ncbi:MAG TPA: hypothetical protein VFJ85_11870 [Acidimicrobiales bacterium]|nr:hypothetical protein [Acidimicrobiales bacterium]
MRLGLAGVVVAAAVVAAGGSAGAGVPGSSCPVFPADNVWHADVSSLPVHPSGAAWLASMGGPAVRIHPDFGPAGPGEQPYGIPWVTVAGDAPKVDVAFEYADESDPGPYPLTRATPVEGGSDRHAIMVDRDRCTLYELYGTAWDAEGAVAGSGAVWDLRSDALRPDGWTSADAAGLPIFAGLLRRDEVASGTVDHAIRMTAQRTDRSYVWPARHQAGAARDPSLPPMGARFRLKGAFSLAGFRPDTQAVLRAMQHYGLILADNGSNWYFTGTSEDGWDPAMLDELKTIPAGAFEAVDASSLMASPDSGRVRAPAPATTLPAATTTTTRPPTTTTRPDTTTTAPATTTSSSTTVPPPKRVLLLPPTTEAAPDETVSAAPAAATSGGGPTAWLLALGAAGAAAGAGWAVLHLRRRRPPP